MKVLSKTCQQLADSVRKTPILPLAPTPAARIDEVDRSLNVVMNGLQENQDSRIWLDLVSEVLRITAGMDVEIADAFRLGGRLASGKFRPTVLCRLQILCLRPLKV